MATFEGREPSEKEPEGATDDRSTGTDEDVPAGGAGSDSGAAEAVGIDETDDAPIQNVSSANDIPGVGTRGPEGEMEPTTADPAAAKLNEATQTRDDEDSGVAHHIDRVASRDGGTRPPHARGAQHRPRLAQNAATLEEELAGIVAQTRADLGSAPEARIRRLLEQRLHDAGIQLDEVDLEELIARIHKG